MFSRSVPILAALAAFAVGCAISPHPDPSAGPTTPPDSATDVPKDTIAATDGEGAQPAQGLAYGVVPRMVVPDLHRITLDVLGEVNASRVAAGLRPLGLDPTLVSAARRYSQELALRRSISHHSNVPGRRTFRQRMAAEGARARMAGENLARMTSSPETLPGNVVSAWLRSPGHRRNLLDPAFSRTGIGVVLGDDGVWYIAQLYASPD